jgi:hypothetical protein
MPHRMGSALHDGCMGSDVLCVAHGDAIECQPSTMVCQDEALVASLSLRIAADPALRASRESPATEALSACAEHDRAAGPPLQEQSAKRTELESTVGEPGSTAIPKQNTKV